jgi:hypothetical protein
VHRDSAQAPGGAASVIGFLKGKSATAMAPLSGNKDTSPANTSGLDGYAVSTVGFELEQVRTHIHDQDAVDEARTGLT